MIDDLPPEILHNILIYLDLDQRLVCLTVCRSWWNVLNGWSLFYNLRISESFLNQPSRFADMFEHSPDLAAQVEELVVEILTETYFSSRRLLNIFPNVHEIILSQHFSSLDSEAHRITENVNMTHLKPKVESLYDLHPFELTSQIIHSNLGGRLELLTLDFFSLSDSARIISQLKDLPVLKKLKLYSAKITIQHLEKIHNDIPSIESFHLHETTIKPGNIPVNIVPAINIKKLTFYLEHIEDLTDHARIYQYATQKYPNITDIEYSDRNLGRNYRNDKKQLYLNGLLNFYKLIGPYTSHIDLHCVPDGVDIFEALDAVDCQVKTLACHNCEGGTLFQYLSQSSQSKHVEGLSIWETSLDSIYDIKKMTNLTRLVLGASGPESPPVHLSDCLDACPPSLKYLDIIIISNSVIIEPFNSILYQIESLDVSYDALSNGFANIITSCFPNLSELSLSFNVDENINIILNQPHLQKAMFYINPTCYDADFGFSLTAPNFTETQHFLAQEEEATHVCYKDIQHLPILSVTSLKQTRYETDEVIILYFN